MTRGQQPGTSLLGWLAAAVRCYGPRVVHAVREFAYGIDTWSAVTHGIAPAARGREHDSSASGEGADLTG
ncbi:hypothetical protein H0B56_06015 [Haloechinothrix sp. YIM 98757]|uniref:Uncharacterized protein n=1 Tax=Haloechinothrix aidingensis TaxID=2752311 RepID=A0A837ZY46_9PSEU|nr:hypothetical protein [Haloechinothrix aidingensis]MBA0125094.1 hypothetical protein [Haloechinothrix aidingensis]